MQTAWRSNGLENANGAAIAIGSETTGRHILRRVGGVAKKAWGKNKRGAYVP